MGLAQQGGGSGHVRGGHRRSGLAGALEARPGLGRDDARAGRGEIGFQTIVPDAGSAGGRVTDLVRQFRTTHGGEGIERGGEPIGELALEDGSVELGDHDPRDVDITSVALAAHFDRWAVHVIDHNDPDGAGGLGAANLVYEKAGPAVDEGDFSLERGSIFEGFAGQRWVGLDDLSRDRAVRLEGWREDPLGGCVITRDGGGGEHLDGREGGAIVERIGHGDTPVGDPRGTHGVIGVAIVACGDHDDDALADEPVDGFGFGIGAIHNAERTSQGEIHDVHMIGEVSVLIRIQAAFQGSDNDRGRSAAGATEDLVGIQLGFRGDSRADTELGEIQRVVVGAGVGQTAEQDAVARGNGGDVGTVGVGEGIERIKVGSGRGRSTDAAAVVVVAHEVSSPDDPGSGKGAGFDNGRIVVGEVLRIPSSAEAGMVVIDSGIDDGDADAAASPGTGAQGPTFRGANPGNAGGNQGSEVVFRPDGANSGELANGRQLRGR